MVTGLSLRERVAASLNQKEPFDLVRTFDQDASRPKHT